MAGELAASLFPKMVNVQSAFVLCPGGRTPKVFFENLTKQKDISWGNITIMATDDRVVPIGSLNSNTGLIKKELVDQIKSNPKPKLLKPFPEYDTNIKNAMTDIKYILTNKLPDLAILGMGSDGHTAGIFNIENTAKFGYYFKNPTDAFSRVTISMNTFLKIPQLVFLILGREKREMLTKVISNSSSKNDVPMKYLLRNGMGVKTIICDIDAAPKGYNVGEIEVPF